MQGFSEEERKFLKHFFLLNVQKDVWLGKVANFDR